mgnify:CR=1 FL=1
MAPPKSVAAQHKGKLDKDDPSLLPSDDDDDSDFHLSDAGDGSDSGDDSDDDDADGPAAKRQKLEQETKPASVHSSPSLASLPRATGLTQRSTTVSTRQP